MKVNNSINSIRKLFLDFFVKNGHQLYSSSSLVPKNDPSLMFTNAGMVQFKQDFTSIENSSTETAVSSQKCLRVGGKHNDLENVGHTNRHHTFFEMLGNFSFGSYFKEQAIELAWKFITQELRLNKDRLYITVYHNDDESYKIWQKVSSFLDEKIIRIATQDNFWSMGNVGPCGPCSEIFYDYGENFFGGLPGTKDADGERFTEIWNLVFMQYNKTEDGQLHRLPKPCIDTGMGLERITAVMQGVHDNYNIDLFKSLIAESQSRSGNTNNPLAHRIIADHIRAAAFLIAEGIMPGNEGRSYVLRRIIRRAVRYVYQLGYNKALLYQVFPKLIDNTSSAYMGDIYPELIRAQDLITMTLRSEEENFQDTLLKGLSLLDKEVSNLNTGDTLPGNVAFKLYDTYGFPLDITLDVIREKELQFDMESFDSQMQEQKERARKSWVGSGEQSLDKLWINLFNQHGKTEFVGYDHNESKSIVLSIISTGKEIINSANTADEVDVILNITPFYGESGGQHGDIGTLELGNNIIEVIDTKKIFNDLHLHKCIVKQGKLAIGDIIKAMIDQEHRKRIRANHSATHLLHHGLREMIGTHVTQKGSLVTADRLRFDFSTNNQLSSEQIVLIEDKVNAMIRDNNSVTTVINSAEEAIKNGAVALFGEKYGDKVRVVSIGTSQELCGGTHVKYSGDIGLFKIISEGSVAFGTRRIEALTGQKALDYIRSKEENLQKISSYLKVAPDDILNRLEKLSQEQQKLKSQISNLYYNIIKLEKINTDTISEINFQHCAFTDIPVDIIRKFVINQCKQTDLNYITAFSTITSNKMVLIIGVSKNLTDKISAAELTHSVEKIVNGKGGGNLELAQISGEANKIQSAISEIHNRLQSIFK